MTQETNMHDEGLSGDAVVMTNKTFYWREHRDFVLNAVCRFTVTIATQIQTVAVGWYIVSGVPPPHFGRARAVA